MRHVLHKAATIRSFGCALALTVSLLTLPGCMTAAKETAEAASTADETVAEVSPASSAEAPPGSYEDQQVVALGTTAQVGTSDGVAANAMVPVAANGQPASLTMQSTGLNATSSSIFSVRTPNAAPVQVENADVGQGTSPLPAGQSTGVNPTSNSLFNAGQPPAEGTPLPLEGASNIQGAVPAAAQQVATAGSDANGIALPAAVPIPSSGDSMRIGGAAAELAATQPLAADAAGVDVAAVAITGSPENDDEGDAAQKPLTFAALFAAKRKNRNQFNGDRFAKTPPRKAPVTANLQQPQIAALGFTALPGVRTTSMFATMDDSQPGHDDESATVEVAALTGLARLAPNGLWLQTEKVETGCFQRELMQVLKVVETHYGRKVMVTSGLRDLKHNIRAGGRRHSLHTTCEAADIQVPGVSKWDLADYLRTIPGRGGVGTYCHTESVHIDTGESRDWNWRCRRRRT